MASEVGHGADDRDGRVAARVNGSRRIKCPGARALDGFVGHAGDRRRGVIFHRHHLTALNRVAATLGRPPCARCIESIAAVTGEVGHSADDGDGRASASVAGSRRIEGPIAAALNGLVWGAGEDRRGRVAHGDRLHRVGAVAGVIGRGPDAGDDIGAATVPDDVGVRESRRTAGVLGNCHAGGAAPSVCGTIQHQVYRDAEHWRRCVTHRDALNTRAAIAAIVRRDPGSVNHPDGLAGQRGRLRRQRSQGRLLLRRRQIADLRYT